MSLGHQVADHSQADFQVRYRNKTQLEHLLKIQKILFRYLLIPLHSNHRLLIFERLYNKTSPRYEKAKIKYLLRFYAERIGNLESLNQVQIVLNERI